MKLEESNGVEFKEIMPDGINKEIIAFLNAHGGTIYIGIKDDGTIVGVSKEKRDLYDLRLTGIMSDGIKPYARNLVSFEYNQDNVLVIKVKEGDKKPYYISEKGPKPSGVYIRYGRSSRPANDDEILTMIRDSSGYLWEKEISEEQDLHFKNFQIMAEGKKLEFNDRKMKTLGIQNSHGEFTNLGLLVSDENPIEVKFAVYDEKMNFKVKKEFTGSIVLIADQLLQFAENFNVTSAVIVPGRIDRVETKSFPGSSLREGILNCLCHADYSMPSNIKVEFFPNRVKLSNPGSIYNASLQDILDGTQTFRNPGLVNILAKLDFIENYGTGILRIQEAYKNEDKKPDFNVSERYFKLSLPNLNYEAPKSSASDAEQMPSNAEQMPSNAEQMLDIDKLTLEIIRNNPGIKMKGIIEALNSSENDYSNSKIENSIKRLRKKGMIKFNSKSTKNGGYFAIK